MLKHVHNIIILHVYDIVIVICFHNSDITFLNMMIIIVNIVIIGLPPVQIMHDRCTEFAQFWCTDKTPT